MPHCCPRAGRDGLEQNMMYLFLRATLLLRQAGMPLGCMLIAN